MQLGCRTLMIRRLSIVFCGVCLTASSAVAQQDLQATVKAELPQYEQQAGVSGNLNSIGSDTLNNLMTFWAEGFRKLYPNVRIQIEGKGSSTAPPALIEGTAQLGPMSRPMKDSEIARFEKAYGFAPARMAVALDALAVFVHRSNPVEALSMAQVDAIFSKTRRCGMTNAIDRWGKVGLTGAWANLPIRLYGRNSASGTYGFFKQHALCRGDFRNSVKEQPGSASVVNGIANDRSGIGYSGIGYQTSGVRTVALKRRGDEPAYAPDYENVLSGKYPLGRKLYVYYVDPPNEPVDPVVREFLSYVLSQAGQLAVVKDGYLPLPAQFAAKQREALQP